MDSHLLPGCPQGDRYSVERMRALTVPWVEGVVHVPLGSGLLPRVSRACGVGRWRMGTAIHTSTLSLLTVNPEFGWNQVSELARPRGQLRGLVRWRVAC